MKKTRIEKVEIYDTTLRDGAQCEGVNFSVSDKLKVVKLLDEFGCDYIELGWPGANPKDIDVFEAVKKINLRNSKICAFGSTKRPFTNVDNDAILVQLAKVNCDIVTIFGKTWDFQVKNALNTTLEENLNMITQSISYLKDNGKTVFFDCEHFFDGYKSNSEYAIICVKNAIKAGAKRIILCDTNGGTMPDEIFEISKRIVKNFSTTVFGIHSHNDCELAVANSLSAYNAGISQIQGTINGYGERCGNANLCSIIANLQLKMDIDVVGDNISNLTYISNSIAEIANVAQNPVQAFVGRSAFSHKAGVHASGVRKNSRTYEHLSPQIVGNRRKILISDQAGTASIKQKVKHLNFVNKINDHDIKKIIEKIKSLEWQGYAFEAAQASFELLVLDILNKKPQFFEILNFRVIGDTFANNEKVNIEASVKLKVGNEVIHTVSDGDGPVNALDNALKKALLPHFAQINKFKLNDFKVRIIDSSAATAAKVRVNIETIDGKLSWDTTGVSENIIEAASIAILDSIIYGLMFHTNIK